MRVRSLDKNHDWTFGLGKRNYLTKSEAIFQNVKTRLLSFKNNWFLCLDHGLEWLELMEKPANIDRVSSMIKLCVLQTDGVVTLDSFGISLDPDTRKLTVHLTYTDIFGQSKELSEPINIR